MVMCQAGYCVMGATVLYKPETRRDSPLWRSEHEFKVRQLDLFLIRSDHARPSLSCPCRFPHLQQSGLILCDFRLIVVGRGEDNCA